MLVLDGGGNAKWSSILLDRGTVPVEMSAPLPKQRRTGSSWDEVRAKLSGRWVEFGGVDYVRILDLFRAISPMKTSKSPLFRDGYILDVVLLALASACRARIHVDPI
jgi:hypothetical protein